MPGNLCEHCVAACCRYIALPIDKPETLKEFEEVRWFLIHEHVSVFVEEGVWHVLFATPCRHLLADHRCGIYQTRPQICREYTADNCDYHSGDYGWEHHFTAPEHLEAYLREHHPKLLRKSGSNGSRRAAPKRQPARARGMDGNGDDAPQTDRYGHALPVLPAMPRARGQAGA